jgi:uncharacterized protein YkwD
MFVLEIKSIRNYVMKKFLVVFFILTNSLFSQDQFNQELIEKMNNLRISVGVGVLKYNPVLDSLAKDWSQYILDSLNKYEASEILSNHQKNPHFLHIDAKERTNSTELIKNIKIERFGKYLSFEPMVDENLIFTENYIINPENVIEKLYNGWFNCRGHYKTMVREVYNSCGFNYAYDSSKRRYIFMVVFASVIE